MSSSLGAVFGKRRPTPGLENEFGEFVSSVLIATASSFCVTLLAILALRPIAVVVDLVDRPGGRKTHSGEIPIVGGAAMFFGLAFGLGVVPSLEPRTETFLAACALLVTVGLLDDKFDLSPWLRLPVQSAAALLAIGSGSGLSVNLGDPLGMGAFDMTGLAAVPVTLLLVVGAINAFNMMDGMDGLAGAVSLVALIAISIQSWIHGMLEALAISCVLAGAVCGFLVFNVPSKLNRGVRCFMGDAGSTLIGFVLALLCLRVSQGPGNSISPMTVVWLVAVPIYEIVWTILRRLSRGHSPFRADREHLHHLLLDAGFGVRGAFVTFLILASILASVGILLSALGLQDSLTFLLFIVAGIATVSLMYRAHVFVGLLPASWIRIDARVQ